MRWLLALALLAPAAAGAAAADVRFADGSPATLAEVSRRYQKDTNRALTDRWVRVAAGGFAPLAAPNAKGPASGAAAVPFLARVNVLGNYTQGPDGRNYYLLASAGLDDNALVLLGWVPAEYVILGRESLADDKSGIKIKAMVINSLRFLKAGGVPDEARVAPPRLLLAPPPVAGADNGPARFFDFYFVWADTDPADESRGYALIGENYIFNDNAEVSVEEFRRVAKILGWVDKARLCFWRTREAVQWDDRNPGRTNPGQAFGTREHAKAAVDPAAYPPPPTPDLPIAEVFPNGKPARWDPKRMRYPVLTLRLPDPDAKGQDPPRLVERPYESVPPNTLRRVGVIGDVFDDKGHPVMSEAARQDIQLDMIRAREQLRRTEILFVIDRTSSMKSWWKATADSVDRLIARVNRDDRSVAVGFCYYGDVNPGAADEGKVANLKEAVEKGGVRPGRLMDARAEAAALRDKLKELADPTQEMIGGGRLEMVYAGLEVGVVEARGWGKHARKMVILIGDDGNHLLPPEEERRVHDRIAARLDPTPDAAAAGDEYETPIEFYALQVCKVGDQPGDPTRVFRDQAEALVGRIKARSPDARAGYFNTAQEDAFLAEIERRYAELKARADGTEEWIQRAQSGQVKAVTEIRDPEAVNILRGIAARRKVKVDDLLVGVQAFDERYVWDLDPKSGTPQLRRMVLVPEGELTRVLTMFDAFFHDPENPPTLDELARQMIATQSGDPRLRDRLVGKKEAEQIAVLAVTYGFSFTNELSTFLGYDRRPGEPPPRRDEAAERRFKQKLQKKYYLLQDLKAERECQYEPLNPQDAAHLKRLLPGRALGPAERRGFKRGDGSITYYWVDLDREWP